MKVRPCSQNSCLKPTISFQAGLTSKIAQEIEAADVVQISKKLAQKGVSTDFGDNKVLAYCCKKMSNIIDFLNQEHKLKLASPKGIYAIDFEKLNVDDKKMHSFCNLQPFQLHKASGEITPSRVLFFNTLESAKKQAPEGYNRLFDWNNINEIADAEFAIGFAPTDSFLDIFSHEFSHVIHEDHLLNRLGGKKLVKILEMLNDTEWLKWYERKYGADVSEICSYARKNPLEAVACDMTKKIVTSLDSESLLPTKNPFKNSAYQGHLFKGSSDSPLDTILRRFYKGKFD